MAKLRSTGQEIDDTPEETVTDEDIRRLRAANPHGQAIERLMAKREQMKDPEESPQQRAARAFDARNPEIIEHPGLMRRAGEEFVATVMREAATHSYVDFDKVSLDVENRVRKAAGLPTVEHRERSEVIRETKRSRGQE